MPQLQYNRRTNPAVPGMPFDMNDAANDIRSYPAAVAVPFGVAVELTAAGVRPAQTATTGAPPAQMIGVSVFDPAREQAYPASAQTGTSTPGYAAGEMVPVMVKGAIWVQFDNGGTWPATFGTVNVRHSSTGANPQGVFTQTAVSAVAGNEIDTCAAWVSGFTPMPNASPQPFVGNFTDGWGNTYGIAPLSVNFPGHV